MKNQYMLCLAAAFSLLGLQKAAAQTPQELAAPIVFKGSELTQLIPSSSSTLKATDLVAFNYNNGWHQVPLQVDEMKQVMPKDIYGNSSGTNINGTGTAFDSFANSVDYNTNANFKITVYCDPNTFVGTDPDPKFDADDELVFMARECAFEAPSGIASPDNVIACSGVKVKLTDNTNSQSFYIYLFYRSSTAIVQSANQTPYVNYRFRLMKDWNAPTDANYKTDCKKFYRWKFMNYEDSQVQGVTYKTSFSDRWIQDYLSVNGSTNLIEGHKMQEGKPAPLLSRCRVNEVNSSLGTLGNQVPDSDTSQLCQSGNDYPVFGTGAFIANISGPIRAIRSVMGTTLAPLSQRDQFFYERAEVSKVYYRAPQSTGLRDFYDYNSSSGITFQYLNNNNPTALTIDGTNDAGWVAGALNWELVSSSSASIFRHYDVISQAVFGTNGAISTLSPGSFYLDQNGISGTSTNYPCTGDANSYGASGLILTSTSNNVIPNTDPRYASSGGLARLEYTQTNIYLPNNATAADAATWEASCAATALTKTVTSMSTGSCTVLTAAKLFPEKQQDEEIAPGVSVYPNPSNGIFTLSASGKANDKIVAIFYNNAGKEVARATSTGNLNQEIQLSAGYGIGQLFIAKISIGSKTYTKKILVDKK